MATLAIFLIKILFYLFIGYVFGNHFLKGYNLAIVYFIA
jgi:hypothetical protein